MKKSLIILSCALALFTTGCIKNSYNIEIDKKDNITVSEIGAINANLIKSINPNATADIKNKLEESKQEAETEGYKAETYDDGTYIGIKQTKNYKLPVYETSDLPKGFSTSQKKPVVINKKFFKTIYTINLDFDIKSASKDENNMSDFNQMKPQNNYSSPGSSWVDGKENKIVSKEKSTDPSTGKTTEKITYEDGSFMTTTYDETSQNNFENAMSSMFESSDMAPVADLTIKIPTKAKEHNANEETKNFEYKWNLISESPINISLIYERTNVLNIVLFICFSIIGFLCIFVLFSGTKHR